MEDTSTKEFEESIKLLNLANNSFDYEKKKLIILIKVKLNTAVFKIYEKDRIWIKLLDFKHFSEYKANLGFDGNWSSFFRTLYLAISREKGGDIQIKYPTSSKVPFLIYFYHPISEDLKVKGQISFENPYVYNSEEFKINIYDLVFDLHESEENLKVNKNFGKETTADISGNMDCKKKLKIDVKKNAKRKFVSDLVNPNAKRRKNKGTKYEDEDDNENIKEQSSEKDN